LSACSEDSAVPIEKETEDEQIIVTEDGMVTFKIYNTAKVSEERIETFKQEISDAYHVIQSSIQTSYIPSEHINVILNKGNQPSWGFRSEIILFSDRRNEYPLVHELTHSLLGYGNNFDDNMGYLTQEGFATYMEDQHGGQFSYSHKLMKYFTDSNKVIPLSKLTDLNQDEAYFRPALVEQKDYTLQWMSYTHSCSFITYLIDTYGLKKFEEIYNQDRLSEKIKDVYGKELNELEKDWLDFIQTTQTELTNEDKMKMGYFYDAVEAIDQIDYSIFIRE
jgi:hypothetical protein